MKSVFRLIPLAILLSQCTQKTETVHVPKSYTAEQLYNNQTGTAQGFNSDETSLMLNSNRTGIFNLFELSIADTNARALTHSVKESYFGLGFVPGTHSFLYSADQGGNENSHLYLRTDIDSVARDLTPWPKSTNNFISWSSDRKSCYFSSNHRDERFFDLIKMDSSSWKPEMIYKNDSGYDVSVVSRTGRYLCLAKPVTTDKNDLYLFDTQAKKTIRLSNDNEATWTPTAFENNDSILYYITNDGKEFSYLIKYHIPSGKTETAYETNWDINGMSLSRNEKYRTIFVNEDGRSKVMLFENATNKPVSIPGLEDATIDGLIVSESEKYLAITAGSSKSPYNVFVYNLETKKLKQVSKSLNPEIDTADMVSAEVVRFKSFDGKEIPAIYYKPLTASKKNKVPAVLYIHGGPGGQSTIYFSNPVQYLVNHGSAVLAVNNRGSSGYGKTFYKLDNKDHGNGDLKDCIWAKKWLQTLDYIDSSRIGIEGGSYGGCMVLSALAFYPQEFRAGVDFFGVANWMRTLKSIPPYWEAFRKALYEEMGDPATTDSVMLIKTSPLFHYQQIVKPLIVFQGMNDVRVLPVESQEIVAGVKKNGVPVEYITYPDEGHGFLKKKNNIDAATRTVDFLDKYLKAPVKP